MSGVGSAQSVFKRRHSSLGANGLPQRGYRLPGMQGAADRKDRRGSVRDLETGARVRRESRTGTRYHRRGVRASARGGARYAGCGSSSHGHGLPMKPELTLAVVEGQPITEMPRDLYIPPQALEVFLEAFEGPLDMLLYLIRRQNLD